MDEFPRRTSAEYAFAEHEHRDIHRGVERVTDVARSVGRIPVPDLSLACAEVVDWVETVLEPHAAWEDRWLYPEIDRRAGTPWATRLMTFEHRQIRRVAASVKRRAETVMSEPNRDRLLELAGDLFALGALLNAHIEREELFLIPVLEDTAGVPV